MPDFWIVALGGAHDGELGLLQTDGPPMGEQVDYGGEHPFSDPRYVVTSESSTLPDGRPALIARPLPHTETRDHSS